MKKIILGILIVFCSVIYSQSENVNVVETTISTVHSQFKSGKLTVRKLVEEYLKRIKLYDFNTKLNSIVVINPMALERADELDKEFKETGILKPLHGIPIIIKDNYDTYDLQTSGGSLALRGSIPPDDATTVKRLRDAGAIVLGKSNMAEWAFSNVVTVSSIAGITRNPYDLSRVPAGSSGGTAASVAANLALIGMGTDTGNSIRGPASHNCLVGIRSTMGLVSRDGIIPLYLRNDIAGPLGRTVEDAVKVLEVIAGYDSKDPVTKYSEGKIPNNYTQYLKKGSLKGVRLGVFRRYIDTKSIDPQIKKITLRAIDELKKMGAIIIDSFDVPKYKELTDKIWCSTFVTDVNNYLSSLGERTHFKTIQEVYQSGLYLPSSKRNLERRLKFVSNPEDRDPPCLDLYSSPQNILFRNAVVDAMDKYNLDAIIYPTWSNQPRKVGDMESEDGDNSQILSPQTGMPAITVPIGFTKENLPAGMTFLGRLFSEPDLIKFVYSYEQETKYRKPPEKFK